MIRRGKEEGWLNLPLAALIGDKCPNFASTFGVRKAKHVRASVIPGRGAALITQGDVRNDIRETTLLTVPRDLVLSKENTIQLAKTDPHLRDVLAASRNSDLVGFLFDQMCILDRNRSCTVDERSPCHHDAFACPGNPIIALIPQDVYMKFLPLEPLPIFWDEEDLETLAGTTLKPATEAKIKSCLSEYENFRSCTKSIPWCQKYWWHETEGIMRFDDWKQVDAMYRSRALEFPGIGDCMVPCMDLANHASGTSTAARYEVNEDGDAILCLRYGKTLDNGQEITITYGDDKGACEMLFSYGFLEPGASDARTLFLDIDVPSDDPLAHAKRHVSTCAPGVRLSQQQGAVTWESPFVWLVIVNEEDGLEFELLQTVEGDRELKTFWQGSLLGDTTDLEASLRNQKLWPVYHLRAVSLVHDRIQHQLEALETKGIDEEIEGNRPALSNVDDLTLSPRMLAGELRVLERNLLRLATEQLDMEIAGLFESDTVQAYLAQRQGEPKITLSDEEDFS